MPISITVRHTDISDAYKDYARDKAREVIDSFPGVESLSVILDKQRHNNLAEVVLQAKRRFRAEAEDVTDDMRKSIDQAFEKIERQIRKHREKLQERRS